MSVTLAGLEGSFDNEAAEELLGLSVGKITYTSQLIRKSMYDFDLETPEGIEKLMALIPIMDPEILKDIMTEIWPNYPTDVDARRHRLEIKGYLKDYLESIDDVEDEAELPDGTPGEGPAGEVEDEIEQAPTAAGAQPAPAAGLPSPAGAPPQPGAAEQTEVAQTPTA